MNRLIAILVAWLASIGVAFAAVNVNTADRKELETLKEIGPVKAQAIVDYRAQHGPFRSLADLDKVPGIGKATLAAIRNEVTISGPDTGLPAAKKDNRAADRADARAQRGTTMGEDRTRESKPRVAMREERSPLDINSASRSELEKLSGVGPARARQIETGRPWRSKNDLVDRRVLPQDVYDQVKDRIVARHSQTNDLGSGG
ncbi:MAG TPA: ComEA family DNA-binding protein [Usitatibacter sp.]|nr:ComEA family DNA-binding protein [Usitatibacter sp.]